MTHKLKRTLGFWQTTLYGVGIILGAGIYALIGVGAGVAQNAIWLSFVLAAFLAFFTGLSYAELSSMYPRDAAEYVYTKHAFGNTTLSFVVQWIMVFTVIVSTSTVALGFAGYFSHVFGGSLPFIAAGLIIILSVINYIGMKGSSAFNVVSTIIETAGLVIVAIAGIFFIGKSNIDYFALPSTGFSAVISGTALIFFAYIGFEEMVNFSEETKSAARIIPKALITALTISTVLYIIVALSAVSIVGWERLAASKAPLTEVVSSVYPKAAGMFSFIALFATANTVLAMLIVGSRMLYGLSCQGSIPAVCSTIGKRGTPLVSISIVLVLSVFMLFFSGIKTVALLTDVGIFVVYIFVNASLIWLRYTRPNAKRAFRAPLSIGKLPLLAVFGFVSSSFMLFYFEPRLLLYELVVAGTGLVFYKIFTTVNHSRVSS